MSWTARQVWKSMSKPDRALAANALLADPRLDRAARFEALAPWIATQRIRPSFLESLPKTRRAELIASSALPEQTAAQALLSLHLVDRREMLKRFMDHMEIPHQDGLVNDEHELKVDLAKLPGAVAKLRSEFDPEAVVLYFRTLVASDPETWKPLIEEAAVSG
jgi:hypothetical protein